MRIVPHHIIGTDTLPRSAIKPKSVKDPPSFPCILQPSNTPTVKDTIEEPTPIPTYAPSNITIGKDGVKDIEEEPSQLSTGLPTRHTKQFYTTSHTSFESKIEPHRRSIRKRNKNMLLIYPAEKGQSKHMYKQKNDDNTIITSNPHSRTDIGRETSTTPTAL